MRLEKQSALTRNKNRHGTTNKWLTILLKKKKNSNSKKQEIAKKVKVFTRSYNSSIKQFFGAFSLC